MRLVKNLSIRQELLSSTYLEQYLPNFVFCVDTPKIYRIVHDTYIKFICDNSESFRIFG